MKKHDYILAYIFSKDECLTPCYGTIQFSSVKKIKTFEDINALNKMIENKTEGAKSVSVYNMIYLGKNKH